MTEHEKISPLTFYCDTLSLLILKLFAKIAKYKLLTQHKLWRHKLVKNVLKLNAKLSIAQLLLCQTR